MFPCALAPLYTMPYRRALDSRDMFQKEELIRRATHVTFKPLESKKPTISLSRTRSLGRGKVTSKISLKSRAPCTLGFAVIKSSSFSVPIAIRCHQATNSPPCPYATCYFASRSRCCRGRPQLMIASHLIQGSRQRAHRAPVFPRTRLAL